MLVIAQRAPVVPDVDKALRDIIVLVNLVMQFAE